MEPELGRTVFAADFSKPDVDMQAQWHVEGKGTAQVVDGKLALRESPGGQGLVLWLRQDLPSDMMLSFDLQFNNNRGIGVFFLAARSVSGKDILQDLPARTGAYGEYTRGEINCYGASLHRFYPDGRQNDGCNLRKNSGFHIVHHAEEDPVTEAGRSYHVKIRKTGPRIRMWVNGKMLHDWTDAGEHGPPLTDGKIGFRIRGDASCVMSLDNILIHAAGE